MEKLSESNIFEDFEMIFYVMGISHGNKIRGFPFWCPKAGVREIVEPECATIGKGQRVLSAVF